MDNVVYSLLAVIGISLLSLIGIFAISINEKKLDNILFILIGFAAGSILGAAYLDLLPQAIELVESSTAFIFVVLGFVGFFFLERFIYWYHGHAHESEIGKKTVLKSLVYLNLLGDGIHNLLDGMIIAASFFLSVSTGVVSVIAVVFHEASQEIGDFGVLLYGGFTKMKALLFNFLTALTAIAGVFISTLFSIYTEGFVGFLIAFASGGFIYLSASELIPEIQQEKNFRKSIIQFVSFAFGLILIWTLGVVFPE